VDRRYLEPGAGLRKDFAGMQALLRRDLRRALSRRTRASVRTGVYLRLVPGKLDEPFRWARPRRVFVNSMSDLFQEGVPDDFAARVFNVMRRADWHTYQLLTKRADRLRQFASKLAWLPQCQHIWLGVSVEDRRYGLPRVDELRETPAAVRFLSIEPLLEDLGDFDLGGINWVIVGGESGPGARPMREEWVLSLRDQCRRVGVPFFFKQWGGVQKGKHGRLLQGQTYSEFPNITGAPAPSATERARRLSRLQLLRHESHA